MRRKKQLMGVRGSSRCRKALLATLGPLLVLFALAGGAAALQLQTGNTVLKFDTRISPRKLPRTAAAPAAVRVSGRISTNDGSVPPNLTKILVKTDDDVAFGTVGLPVCRPAKIQAVTNAVAARVCRRALVGRGALGIVVAFPNTAPFAVRAKILIFNGGVKHGVPELLVHSYQTTPTPAAFTSKVQIKHVGKGHGVLATAKLPRIAGGSGSVTFFKARVGKKYSFKGKAMSVVSANCSHRRIRIGVRGIFGNGTSVRGSVAHGCGVR